MDLTQDQDDAVRQNILKSMAPSDLGSSYNVNSQGPNMDDTVKMAGNAPVNTPTAAPEAIAPLPLQTSGAGSSASAAAKPATPTGAPYTPPANDKIMDAHAPMAPDAMRAYLDAQRQQVDKYGPDQEKAVMDDIYKRQHSLTSVIGGKMHQAADDIMQGVARAGKGDAAERYAQGQQNEVKNAMAQNEMLHKDNAADMGAKQSLDAMDHNSPLGKAMLSTWGPLLTKLGVPADKQAAMVPSLISNMEPGLEKHEDVLARIQAAKMQRDGMMGYRQDQSDQNQWVKLGDHVNALTAGSRKALGIAASSNMRADRLLQTASDPKATPNDIANMVADLQGIYKGGVPDEISLKHGSYNTLTQDLSRIQTYITANPASAKSPEVVSRLAHVAGELKKIDNKVIEDNLGLSAAQFRPIISKDPGRWQDMMESVRNTETGPAAASKAEHSAVQEPAAQFPDEASAEKAGLPPGTVISIGGRRARVR